MRPMPLLERYIFRRTAAAFLVTLGVLVAVIWLTQVLRELDVVTAKGQTIWVFGLMTVLALPTIVETVAPVAFVVAALFTLNAMNGDNELAVISAAGAARRVVDRPLLRLAALLFAVLVLFHHVVSPASLGALRGLITRVRADLIATLVRDGGFRTVEDGLTIHIRDKAADGSLRGIFVSDERSETESLQYVAESGALMREARGAFLVMQSGDLIRSSRMSGEASVVRFDTYAFDLSQFTRGEASGLAKPRERSTLELLSPDPADAEANRFPQRAMAELHGRFASPLYVPAFALIALAFAGRARTNRQDRATSLVAAAGLALALRGAGFGALAAANASAAAVPFLYAVPLLGMAAGWMALRSDARHSAPHVFEALSRRSAARFQGLGRIGAGRLAGGGGRP